MTKQLLVPEQLVNLATAPPVTATSIALVQNAPTVACASTAGLTQTFSSSTTIGNWIIACTYENTGTPGTVTGGGVTTWTKQASNYNSGVFGGEIWYGRVTSPATVVTYAPGGGSNFCGLVSSEWSGFLVATPVSSSTGTGVTSNPVVGLGSVVSAVGQLVVVACTGGTALLPNPPQEPGVGWTNLGYGTNGATFEMQADYMLNPTIGTYTPSWVTTGGNMAANITGIVFSPGTTAVSAVAGQTYYDTTLQQVGVYTSSGWQYLGTVAQHAADLAAIAVAQAAATTDYPLLRMAFR